MDSSKRPSWDQYFINICTEVKSRSTCLRRQIGAIVVRNNRILVTGYNGAPPGLTSCLDKGFCIRQKLDIPSGENSELCRAIHAEQNCITQAALFGISLKDATLYVTTSPCSICVKLLIGIAISEIVICGPNYPDKLATELLNESNITIRYIK